VGSQIPEKSTNTHFGGVVLEAGRRQGWVMVVVARECQNPENEQNMLIFRVGRLVVSQLYVE